MRSSSSGAPVDQACGLHAVGYWTGYFVTLALVAAERLGQAAVEELGRVEDPGRDPRRLLLEAVAPQAPGDERVVERPDRADVVADRVVARLALGQRAHAPAGEEPRPHQVPDDGLRLRLVDDAAPEQVAVVRGQRVDLLALGVEREREVLAVLDPEVAVEAALEVGRLLLELVGEVRVVPDARAPAGRRASSRRRRSPAARRSPAGSRAAARRGRRSSPRSPSSTGSRGRSPRCGAGTRCSRCPGGRRTRRSRRAPPAPRARARARACGRRSSARTRRAARRRAASRRRSRSTASAAAPRTRSSRRSASRAGSGPDPRRGSRRRRVPCHSPSAVSVVAASSGANGSAWRLVKMLSRPNIVMNHGRPAAGRLRPPATGGEKRSAARSTRLRRYVRLERLPVALEPRRRPEPALEVRAPSSGARTRLRPCLAAAPYAGHLRRRTSSSVVHSPCGRDLQRRRSARSRRPPPALAASRSAVARANVSRS